MTTSSIADRILNDYRLLSLPEESRATLSKDFLMGYCMAKRLGASTDWLEASARGKQSEDFIVCDTFLGFLSGELSGHGYKTRHRKAARVLKTMFQLGLVDYHPGTTACRECVGRTNYCYACEGTQTIRYTIVTRRNK